MNDFMISSLLTNAEYQLVQNFLSPKKNVRGEGFEESETRRRKLAHLLRTATLTTPLPYNANVNFGNATESKVFDLSSLNILEIKAEYLIVSPLDCDGATELKVVPATNDELLEMRRNPFRKPNKWSAWRLDLGSDVVAGTNYVKPVNIISSVPYTEYRVRYVKRPRPIIVGDLTLIQGAPSIDGETQPRTCDLDEIFHRDIVLRAVANATEITGKQRSQTVLQKEAFSTN